MSVSQKELVHIAFKKINEMLNPSFFYNDGKRARAELLSEIQEKKQYIAELKQDLDDCHKVALPELNAKLSEYTKELIQLKRDNEIEVTAKKAQIATKRQQIKDISELIKILEADINNAQEELMELEAKKKVFSYYQPEYIVKTVPEAGQEPPAAEDIANPTQLTPRMTRGSRGE